MRALETTIALRYLRSKRKEVFISIITVISVIGVAVSVMVLNMTLSIMTGFERELKAKLLDTTAHVVVRNSLGRVDNWEEVKTKIEKLPFVREVTPYTYNQAMLSTPAGAHGLLIRGIEKSNAQREKLEQSRLPRPGLPDNINVARTVVA